jgi:hypothetical protein
MNLLSPSGFILMNNVFPSDEFAFYSDSIEAIKARRLHMEPIALEDFSWTGDVFKTIALIHDYYTAIEYRTFWDNKHQAQTVLWRGPTRKEPPHYENIFAISDLSYKRLLDDIHILKPQTETSIFSLLGRP